MNKRVVRRLLETFFRRWWLYLLPLVLFVAMGVLQVSHSSTGYQSVGVVDVSSGTLLSQLTSIRGDTYGYQTPAVSTAKTLSSLLATDNFVETVASQAGVSTALKSGELTALGLRQSISASANGDNLLAVVATTANPELSSRLVKATIDSFLQYVVAGKVSDSRAAVAFFENQLAVYRGVLDSAKAAQLKYASEHPGGPLAQRPLSEQIEIQSLQSAVDQAQSQYTAAQQKGDEARLATEQATSDVSQQLRIIDEPQVPNAPQPRLKKAVLGVGVFMFVGLIISGGAVVLATVIDRSLRSAEDVQQLLGLPILAVVPEARRAKRSRRASQRAAAQPAVPTRRAPTKTGTQPRRDPADAPTSRASASRTLTKATASAGRTSHLDTTGRTPSRMPSTPSEAKT